MSETKPMYQRFVSLTIPQMLWVIVKLLCSGVQSWVVVNGAVTAIEQHSDVLDEQSTRPPEDSP